jgi:hypothetical protein
MSQTIHMVCGGESPETRQGRTTDERMDWEQNVSNRERCNDLPRLKTKEEVELHRLNLVLHTFQNEISALRSRVRELEAKLEAAQ